MRLTEVISALEEFAPRALQESWDNSGLLVSLPDGDGECTGALLCVDVSEEIVAEAVRQGCNLIVSHHPLIFKGLKSLAGRTPAERTVAAAVRNGVAVYCAHTSLDSTVGGVSYAMASRLGAKVERVLSPVDHSYYQLSIICPREKASDIRLLLLDSGCGTPFCAGNFRLSPTAPVVDDSSSCLSADIDGEKLKPAESLSDILSHRDLTRVSTRVAADDLPSVLSMLEGMPEADSLTIDVVQMDNKSRMLGLGVVASFEEPMPMSDALQLVKERFGCTTVRSSASYTPGTMVRKIALCGGAGGEFIALAERTGAQLYVTADIRYHDFADHRSGMTIFDIGHFESESCAKDIFYHILKNKFANFAVYYSEIETNPVKYL